MERKPDIDEIVSESEKTVEFSVRRPQFLQGTACAVLGLPMAAEPLIRQFSSLAYAAEFLAGLIFIYAAVWVLVLSRREYVCITDKQILHRKVDLLGRRTGVRAFALRDIKSVRLCKSSTMYRQKYSGEVLLVFRNKKKHILPFLENGQYILDAIREQCDEIAADDRRAENLSSAASI